MEEIKASLEESDTIEKSKVLLNREWSLWENYEAKNEKLDYSLSLKEIYSFNDIISFWQFWNNYPGSDLKTIFVNGNYISYFFKEKYRITAINLFQKGIKPEWEDSSNIKGNILTLAYLIKYDDEVDEFLSKAKDLWEKLVCILIGEDIPNSKYINGIRFVDKTRLDKNVKFNFKYEIWVNKDMQEKELDELKEFCTKFFGTKGTIKPIN